MISDVEHPFLGLLASQISPLGGQGRILCPIIHKVFGVFLVLSCTSMLYSLDINSLWHISVVNHFCCSTGCLSFHWCFPLLGKTFSCQCTLDSLCLLWFLLSGETYLENHCSGCVQEIIAYIYLSEFDGFRGHLQVSFPLWVCSCTWCKNIVHCPSFACSCPVAPAPHSEHAVFPPCLFLSILS